MSEQDHVQLEEQEEEVTQEQEQTEEDKQEPQNDNNNNGQIKEEKDEVDSTEERRKKAFITAEFNKLRSSLDVEKQRIQKPEYKEYSPFIWTSLEPYHNTCTVNFILDYPEHVRHGYITRKTAIGIVDPEVSHDMDVKLDDIPPSTPRSPREEHPVPKINRGEKAREAKGSTRLPKWPVVKFDRPQMAKERLLNWGDVPKLREDLRVKYSSNAHDRVKADANRTKHDWYRMDLAQLKDINEVSRSHMKITCHAYLGTSPGSKKAISSLAKVLE